MPYAPRNESVLIVGAGVVGIACAHYLAEAGFDVTVIDQGTVGGGCSQGNCGYLCPSHVLPLTEPGAIATAVRSLFNPKAPFRVRPRLSPAFVNWMWQFARRCNGRRMREAAVHLKAILDSSMAEYRELLTQGSIDSGYRPTGLLHVMQTPAGMADFAATDRLLADEFGVTARRIEGDELPGFEPALKSGLAGAFYYEGDAFLRPERLNASWSARLRDAGVDFIEHCALQSVEKEAGRIQALQTARGRMTADHYVIAAGAWSATLQQELGCRIPVEPGKGYAVTMRRPERCPGYPMLFPEHNIGVTAFDDGYRLASMMEFTGYDTSIPDYRIRQLRESAEPYLVEPHTDTTLGTWYGWRPMTWDSLPIIGRVPGLENACLATGHNMLGLSMAAGTGRLVAEIVQRRPTHIDASAYSPARF